MLMLLGDVPPATNPLINTVIEIQQEEVEPKPKVYTIEEKIERNHYKCDEDTQYIRKDNAKCLDKPIQTAAQPTQAVSTQNTVNRTTTAKNKATAHSGWFPVGECTWWVSTKRSVGRWNNASDWLWQAKRDGYATGSTPRAGAIAWKHGHVAFVQSVNGNKMVVSEANYDYNGSIRTIEVPASSYSAFIY